MDTSAKEDLARDMKESMCFVVADFEKECAKAEEDVDEQTYAQPTRIYAVAPIPHASMTQPTRIHSIHATVHPLSPRALVCQVHAA